MASLTRGSDPDVRWMPAPRPTCGLEPLSLRAHDLATGDDPVGPVDVDRVGVREQRLDVDVGIGARASTRDLLQGHLDLGREIVAVAGVDVRRARVLGTVELDVDRCGRSPAGTAEGR